MSTTSRPNARHFEFRISNFEFLIALAVASLLLTGCLTTRPRSQAAGAGAFVIEGVPQRTWGDNSCGAGALSTILNRFGDPVTEAELDAALAKGRNRGVVSLDLLLEAKRRGYDARLVRGDASAVVEEITNGRPVILMLKVADFPGESRDLFHYIVIDGIDTESELLRMQFGDGKIRWAKLSSVEKAWSGGGHAMLAVRGRSAGTPDVAPGLRRAVALEESGRLEEAIAIYRQLAVDAPEPALVWTNIGNAQAKLGRAGDAEAAYRKAIALDAEWRDALNNLAWLLFEESRDLPEAEELATRAVAARGTDDWNVLETLGRIQIARGRCAEGVATLRRAAELAPDEAVRGTIGKTADDGCRG